MEYVIKHIGNNKVTLDIKPNQFEESYNYPDETYERFGEVDNVMEFYREMQEVISKQPPPPPKLPRSRINEIQPHTRFLYCVLLSLDETLTLISDPTEIISKFRKSLKEKFTGSIQSKMKKYGYNRDDVIASIDQPAESLYLYVMLLLEKSVLRKTDMKLYENYGKERCLVLDEVSLTCDEVSLSDAKNIVVAHNVAKHKDTTSLEKLNTLLVKELKELAEELGCETTKIEEGKKKNLLKAELREVIKAKLYA